MPIAIAFLGFNKFPPLAPSVLGVATAPPFHSCWTRVYPQPSLVSFSHAHTHVSSGSSIIPFGCELGWRLVSLSEWVGGFAISPYTQYIPVILLCVHLCDITSFLLPLSLYTFYSFHLKTLFLQFIYHDSLLHLLVLSGCYHPDLSP